MMSRRLHFVAGGCLAFVVAMPAVAQDWPNWRGPHHNGATAVENLPRDFAVDKHVRWVADMPGPGASTPIVVGERIFLSSVDTAREQLVAICLDRNDGSLRWSKDAGSGYKPNEQATRTAPNARARASYACPSAVADGERVVFFFGNGDLVAYDYEGEELWRRNLQQEYGNFAFNWTFSASPTLVDGVVFLPVLQRDEPIARGGGGGGRGQGRRRGPSDEGMQDPQESPQPIDSFILAVDVKTGETIYKHVRPSPARVESLESYTTMVPFVGADGQQQMLLVGGDVITGHDPATGKELWRWGTWNEGHREQFWRLVPSVVTGDGVALICAPKRAPVYAVKLGGSGELGPEALVWQSKGRPNPVSSDVPTPAFADGCFYVLSDVQNALSKVRAKDGEVIWTTELPKDHLWRASPTVADGHVWCINHNGLVVVIDAADGAIVHKTPMAGEDDDQIRASIVVAHQSLLIRTNDKLFCIGK